MAFQVISQSGMATPSKKWQDEAQKVLNELRDFKSITHQLFPQNEHMSPLDKLMKPWRGKVVEFFTRDLQKLVHLGKLEALLEKANSCGVERENPFRQQLHDIIQQANETRKTLAKRMQMNNIQYHEAKKIFSELVSGGIYFPECTYIAQIVGINCSLEQRLAGTVDREAIGRIQRMMQMDKARVDSSLIKIIFDLVGEFERLETKINSIIEKNNLDFEDHDTLADIENYIKKSRLVLPNDTQFKELFESYTWVIKACLEYRIHATNLTHAIIQLKAIFEHKLDDNFSEIIFLLNPVTGFSFSVSPIKEFLVFCRLLLWRAKIKSTFSDNELDLNSLEEILATVPQNIEKYSDANREYELISTVCEKAKDWRKISYEYLNEVESLFSLSNSSTILSKIKLLHMTLMGLQNSYVKEDLKLIKNLTKLFEQISQTQTILVACSHIAKVIGDEVIDVEDFVTITEIIESNMKEDRKYSTLMLQFQHIQKELVPSLDQLNKIYNALQDTTHQEVKERDNRAIMNKQREKIKVFDIDFHLQKLTNRLNLGDFGQKVKIHLDEFFRWESEAKKLMAENPIKPLLKFVTREQLSLLISKTKSLKDSFIKSQLYTDVLEDLLTYYWCLRVVAIFFTKTDSLERLTRQLENPITHNEVSAKLYRTLRKQASLAKQVLQLAEKCEKDRPDSTDIRKAKEILVDLKIKLSSSQLKKLEQYIDEYQKVRSMLKEFLAQNKPSMEQYKDMIEKLRQETVNYKREINSLNENINDCKLLLKLAKKKNKPLSLAKKYAQMNINCPEFEAILREKSFDNSSESEFEKVLEGTPTFEQLHELEVKGKTLEDSDWEKLLKERIFFKKVSMIEDALKKTIQLKLSFQELKTLAREGKTLGLSSEEFYKKLQVIEDVKARVDNRLTRIKEPADLKIYQEKRVFFRFVDVSKELDEIAAILKKDPDARLRSKTSELKKRKPDAINIEKLLSKKKKGERRERTERRDRGISSQNLALNEDEEKKKQSLEQLKNTIKAGIGKEVSRSKPKAIAEPKDQTSAINFLMEINNEVEDKEKENIQTSQDNVQKPKNSSGTWGIFEGNCRIEENNRSVDEVRLVTFDSWNKIRGFPQLPLTLSFKEKKSKEELGRLIETYEAYGSNSGKGKILAGMVCCEGLSRINFKELFDKEAGFYHVQYSRKTSLVIIPAKSYENSWFSLFDMSDRVKMVDCDFYFLVFTETEHPVIRINPFKVDRLPSKENSSFTFDAFKELETEGMIEKPKSSNTSRIKTTMNVILSSNLAAINRADKNMLEEAS